MVEVAETMLSVAQLLREMPDGYEEACFKEKAIQRKRGIEHCIDGDGSFLLRVKKGCFKMYSKDNKEVDLLQHLQALEAKEALDLSVYIIGHNKQCIPLRVCAKRKTEEGIIATEKKMRRKECLKQTVFSEETKRINEYVILVTNLPNNITADQALALYRLRWQVEIHFKRLKSILNFGELPKKRPDSAMAWLNGKIIVALLIEKILGKNNFSPSGKFDTEHMA